MGGCNFGSIREGAKSNKAIPIASMGLVYLGKRPLWYVPVLPPLYRCTITINSMVFAVSQVSNSVSPLLDM